MTDSNKASLVMFAKVLCVFIIALVIIISGAGVWNACALGAVDGFVCGVSVVNFCLEVAALVWTCVKWVFVKKE